MTTITQSRFPLINPAVNNSFLFHANQSFFQQSKTSIFQNSHWHSLNGKKNPFFSVTKAKWGFELRRAQCEGESNTGRTESQINKCQKPTHIFMELRESAAPVKHTGHTATNEAWHFNHIRMSSGKEKHMDFGKNALRHFRGLNWESTGWVCGQNSFQAVQCCSSDDQRGLGRV